MAHARTNAYLHTCTRVYITYLFLESKRIVLTEREVSLKLLYFSGGFPRAPYVLVSEIYAGVEVLLGSDATRVVDVDALRLQHQSVTHF